MEGGKGGRRMKEMIDEARNAHVDPPQSGDGKHLPDQAMSPISRFSRFRCRCKLV